MGSRLHPAFGAFLLGGFFGLAGSVASLAQTNVTPVASPVPARLATHTLLLDAEGDIAVGDRGLILNRTPSEDGCDWCQEPSPSRSLLTAVASDGSNHWAIGHDKTILRSTGGRDWKLVDFDPGEREDLPVRWTLLDLHWFDAREALIVGSYGLLMRSRDGGKTWTQSRITWKGFVGIDDIPEDDFETLPDNDEIHLYRLRQSPGGTLFCVGEAGTVLRSSDRGKTWERGETSFEGALNDLLVLDDNTILAVGILGTLLRSGDGGASFNKVDLGTRSILHALVRGKDGSVWALGDGGARFKSTDTGKTFRAEPISERVSITGGNPDHPRGGYLLTEQGIRPW